MKQSEKMLVFALGALFHAARIGGASAARGPEFEHDDVSCDESMHEAVDFYYSAQRLGYAPDLPEDDKPRKP